MNLFFTLLLAHLFADFPLQSNALVRYKSNHIGGVLLHALIYTIVTALLIDRWSPYWPWIIGLGTVHFVIDAVKSWFAPRTEDMCAFLLDQSLHLLTMVIATVFAYSYWSTVPTGIVPATWQPLCLFAAFLPAFMVGYWVWAMSSGYEFVKRKAWLHRIHSYVLVIEQRFGLVVLALIIWAFV